MSTFLFNKLIFGPVHSRRLGLSLGINLLPVNRKMCTFDCIYCECGFTPDEQGEPAVLPTRSEVADALEEKLIKMKAAGKTPDSITFAGNGEPTIHPAFPGILEDTLKLRSLHFPDAEVTVLSNSSTLHNPEIFIALSRVDNNILKLDAGLEATFQKISKPLSPKLTLDSIVKNLMRFRQKVIIQTLFVRGEVDGEKIDNTKPAELHAWMGHIKQIQPRYVMLYPIDRSTPTNGLEVVSKEDLYKIADMLRAMRIKYSVY
ncbi:MAG TPA: radical SAM protein [Bacteroidales bacterium]|nr:radical SAM protein [Bacteroidales bacterium]